MTDKDKKLIERANRYSNIDWPLVTDLEKLAESEEAKKILHDKATRMHHMEEASIGLL